MQPQNDLLILQDGAGCRRSNTSSGRRGLALQLSAHHNLIDREKYTVVGYSNYDLTEPLNTPLLDPLLGFWRT